MNGRQFALIAAALLLVGCRAGSSDSTESPGPSTSATSSAASAPPTAPPTAPATFDPADISADVLQFSHDAARGRIQVYVANGGDEPLAPTSIVYSDPRLGGPIDAGRMREILPGSERGFPIALPSQPDCTADVTDGSRTTLTVSTAQTTAEVTVTDSTDLIERAVSRRCLELAVAEVAPLSWAAALEIDADDGTAHAVLVATGTRAPGSYTVVAVGGTHLFTLDPPAGGWGAGIEITGAGDEIRLPLRPARCDAHGFGEGGNAAAFAVHVIAEGRAGEFLVRMTPAAMADAIAYAQERCASG